ncbi:MAG TPA: CcmD family protein [Vicinamibacterales bacterium]|nr:CcmD family protein [Vicinamibacterales bacterium]
MRSLLLAFGVLAVLAGGAAEAAFQDGRAPAGQEEYVPVSELGDVEPLPAAPLVMTAYAAIWVGVFVYLWSIWRRLGAVDRELATLRQRIAAKDSAGPRSV